MERLLVMSGVAFVAGYCAGRLVTDFMVQRLRLEKAMVEQTSGVLCDLCGWAMKFPDEPCRCELVKRLEETQKETIGD